MARHDLPLSELPRVLYTFKTQEGDKRVIVINRDLDDLPYWYTVQEEMFEAQTPSAVRTYLFNANVASNKREGMRRYASHVERHTTNNGQTFLEVQLTIEGAKFIMQDLRGAQNEKKKIMYDNMHVAADKLFATFSAPLKDALTFLGLRPA